MREGLDRGEVYRGTVWYGGNEWTAPVSGPIKVLSIQVLGLFKRIVRYDVTLKHSFLLHGLFHYF